MNGNKVERYKARYVARGFTQHKGIDYHDTSSPLARIESIRILLTLANQFDLTITQMDVKTAFLYGSLDEEIYIEQSQGFEINDEVCKLEKSLYGLKQASKQWNQCFSDFLKTFKLQQLHSDSCIFHNGHDIQDKTSRFILFCNTWTMD